MFILLRSGDVRTYRRTTNERPLYPIVMEGELIDHHTFVAIRVNRGVVCIFCFHPKKRIWTRPGEYSRLRIQTLVNYLASFSTYTHLNTA